LKDTLIVKFPLINKAIEIEPGITVLEAARRAGIVVSAVCNGKGTCGSCKVMQIGGNVFPLTPTEKKQLTPAEISSGIHLSCQLNITENSEFLFPPGSLSSTQRLQLEGNETIPDLDSSIKRVPISIQEFNKIPILSGLINDHIKTRFGFHSIEDPELLNSIVSILQKSGSCDLVVDRNAVICALPGNSGIYGLAVDVGTTKIALFLLDMSSGKTIACKGVPNPQVSYGDDVISRIAYTNKTLNGQQILHDVLMEAINKAVNDMCMQASIEFAQLVQAVIVGNTVMHHVITNLPVKQLGEAPYQPVLTEATLIFAKDINLKISPRAMVYFPPNIAGFVGGDHVAMLLSSMESKATGTTVLLDIGTNTEISLIDGENHLCCSCASGPAFEGARITDGIKAVSGAIERVVINGEEVYYQTIDDLAPIGICGSGILDTIAMLYQNGFIDSRGAFTAKTISEKTGQFIIVPAANSGNDQEIKISAHDINEIRLAKAAIRSGIEVLLKEMQMTYIDIDRIIIAGAFGTYLDIRSAQRIGLLPPIPEEKIVTVGNAAGSGAKQLLLSNRKRYIAEQLAQSVHHVELMTHKDYFENFVDAINFPVQSEQEKNQ